MNKYFSNDYELLERIGEGGLCVIWKIRPKKTPKGNKLDDFLAFKQLKEKTSDNLEAIKSEYRFLKFHKHPGVVEAFDFIDSTDLTGFCMEFLNGPTLQTSCGKLEEKALRKVILNILEIALFVYNSGYVYNDYKPQNFVYNFRGELKLIDFNLIQPLNKPPTGKSGTLGYIAPEILTGDKASSFSDIYSIGVTLYELVEGRMPFSASNEDELIKLVTESAPTPPGSLDKSLNETIVKMLSVKPLDRPADPYEVCQLLGIENEINKLIKGNSRFYFNSGCWPFASEFVKTLCKKRAVNKPLVVVSTNKHENNGFYEDVVCLAGIELGNERVVPISEDDWNNEKNDIQNMLEKRNKANGKDGESGYDINKVENPYNPLQKRLLKIFQEGKLPDQDEPVYLINCQDDICEEIINVACPYDTDSQTSREIILFTCSKNVIDFKDKIRLYDLTSFPNRTVSYLEKLMKRYRIDKEFIDKMEDLSGGDPEVISEYLYYLLDENILRFGRKGWEIIKRFDDSVLPENIRRIYNDRIDVLTKRSLAILQWLAILNVAQNSETLSELVDLDLSQTEKELCRLRKDGWLKYDQGSYFFSSQSMAKAVYGYLSPERRLSMHRKVADYIKLKNPQDIDGLAFHYYLAKNHSQALRYNYDAALKWFNDFDYDKANRFICMAENVFPFLKDNEEESLLVFDTLLLSGDIAKALADNVRAEQKYKAAVEVAEKINDRKALAITYKNLGDLYRLGQEFTKSIEFTDKALNLYRKDNDLPHQAACLNNLGLAMWTIGKYDEALENYEKALKINERINDLTAQAKINSNIGIIYDLTGRTTEVMGRFNKALECAQVAKDRQSETLVLNNIGFFNLNSGKPLEALEYFKKGYEIAVDIGYAEQQLNIISNIAQAYHKTGNFIKSAESNHKALDIAKALKHRMYQAQASQLLAVDCMAMGNFKLALRMLTQADVMCAGLSNQELAVDILLTGIELELLMGDIGRCQELQRQLGEKQNLTRMQIFKGKLLEARLAGLTLRTEAGKMYEELVDEAIKYDFGEIAGSALVSLAEIYLKENNYDDVERSFRRFKALKIQNVIIKLDHNMILAAFHYRRKRYDPALELIKTIKETAENSGCMYFIFKAIVLESDILFHCGKYSVFMKRMKQAQNIFNILVDAFPDERNIEGLEALPFVKRFNFLVDKMKATVDINQ